MQFISHKMGVYSPKIKFGNLYKFYFSLSYNPEIGIESSVSEADSHFTHFFLYIMSLVFAHPLSGDRVHLNTTICMTAGKL